MCVIFDGFVIFAVSKIFSIILYFFFVLAQQGGFVFKNFFSDPVIPFSHKWITACNRFYQQNQNKFLFFLEFSYSNIALYRLYSFRAFGGTVCMSLYKSENVFLARFCH